MRALREVGIAVLIAAAVFGILQLNVQSYTVHYTSMLPGIEEHDWIMVNKASYFFGEPHRGDVIVFDTPFDSPRPFIKRIVGLPGDIVEIRAGRVHINGTALNEEYTAAPTNYVLEATRIPENEYFVLGDNRNNSRDSRYGWTVPRENIRGKAWFTYWPPGRSGAIAHYRYPELSDTGDLGLSGNYSSEV
jgi:signal peptidase I